MKSFIYFLFFFSFSLCLHAQQERHVRARVDLRERTLQQLAALGLEIEHGLLAPGQFWEAELSVSELEAIQKAGYKTEVIIPDLLAQYLDQQRQTNVQERNYQCSENPFPYQTPKGYTYGSMGGYHTYQQALNLLDTMSKKYPNLITARIMVSDTLRSFENRPIWYVKISDNPNLDETEPEVLYTALHHAREPNSLSQMLFFMLYLLENYNTDKEIRYIVDHTELYFIPCINPDGYLYNEQTNPSGGGFWRKNRRKNDNGTFGVDLNRNYGYFWGHDEVGSSSTPSDGAYRGKAPFSEPETRIIRDFCRTHDFDFIQNNHTWGNLLIYPWAYSDKAADTAFIKYGSFFTQENRFRAGVTTQTVGYQVNGSSDDWMYAEKGSFSFTPEIGPATFWPNQNEIDFLNKSMMPLNLKTALCALRYGEAKEIGANEISSQNFDLPVLFTRYGLSPGKILISIEALSKNITSVSSTQSVDIPTLKTQLLKFNAQLSSTVNVGDPIIIVLKTDNGFYVKTDTLRKYYGGIKKVLFQENGTNTTKWTGNWAANNNTFYSAPSCISDSPNGDYGPNASVTTKTAQPIALPFNARKPELRFWAKWDLERGSDYVALRLIETDGTEHLLCGQYSKLGSDRQLPGEPIYDNVQVDWVSECIDLSAFRGKTFRIAFELVSDQGVQRDGFNFDDLSIDYIDPTILPTETPDQEQQYFYCSPNPANTYALISMKDNWPINDATCQVMVFNATGELISQAGSDNQTSGIRLDTQHWPAGTYTLVLRHKDGIFRYSKLVVQH